MSAFVRAKKPAKAARPVAVVTPARRLTAEFLGTALLLAAVVGSGTMGERFSGGNVAIALFANTLARGDARHSDLDFRPCIGGAFQSRRDSRGREPRGIIGGKCRAISRLKP